MHSRKCGGHQEMVRWDKALSTRWNHPTPELNISFFAISSPSLRPRNMGSNRYSVFHAGYSDYVHGRNRWWSVQHWATNSIPTRVKRYQHRVKHRHEEVWIQDLDGPDDERRRWVHNDAGKSLFDVRRVSIGQRSHQGLEQDPSCKLGGKYNGLNWLD